MRRCFFYSLLIKKNKLVHDLFNHGGQQKLSYVGLRCFVYTDPTHCTADLHVNVSRILPFLTALSHFHYTQL